MARVLIIDRDEEGRVGLAEVLFDLGHDARFAPQAFTALELYQREEFDLVIADLALPGTGGLGLIQELQYRFPAVRVIATGRDPNQLYLAEVNGAFRTLAKPIDPAAVGAAVDQVLQIETATAVECKPLDITSSLVPLP